MTTETTKSIFWKGARDAAPFILVVGPFAVLFGVVATEAGLEIAATMSFSVFVIAGAAQLTALQLLVDQAPTVIVLVSALAVNLRMAMYSASLTPYLTTVPFWQRALVAAFLVDQNYALSVLRFEQNPHWSMPQRVIYYFGTTAPVAPMWYAFTLIGALVGSAIPKSFALDFAVPIAFLALVTPMLRTPAHVAAALVSILVALALAFLPYNLGLLVAGLLAMATGAEVERRMGGPR
ncbi:MAG: AzlC family ABC transporter permease [Roseovarius sp.]|nr:AzlC family ABC transporter permease [Roseovarius sp.]